MIQQRGKIYTYEQLIQIYKECGYELLSPYEVYLNNGRSHARLDCKNIETGYKYSVNVTNLRHEFTGANKFDSRNPFRVENLQKWCNDNHINLKILSVEKEGRRCKFIAICPCGRTFKALVNSLLSSGKDRCNYCSAKESKFEIKVRQWLEIHKISFLQEYKFDDCRNIRPLPFDFFVKYKEKIVLIEVDGSQHFYVNQYTAEEELKIQQINDSIKNKYCQEHGYTLVRIPYWLFRTNTYQKILSKTFFGDG